MIPTSTTTECNYLYGCIFFLRKKKKKPVTYAKISQDTVKPRYIAWNAEEEEEEDDDDDDDDTKAKLATNPSSSKTTPLKRRAREEPDFCL